MVTRIATLAAGIACALACMPGAATEVFHNDEIRVQLTERSGGPDATGPSEPGAVKVFFNAGNLIIRIASPPRDVTIEFARFPGDAISEQLPVRRRCNEGNARQCVTEKHLFCTTRLCAEDVTMAAGATRSGFASDDDQMLVAVTDYQLADDFDGSTTSSVERTSGQVEWLPKGHSANRRTNAGSEPARFILIRFSASRGA